MTETIAIWIGERLLLGSIQAAVLVSLVWLTCRLFRRIPAAAQAALWWLVALKLTLVFAPMPAVAVPVFPSELASQTERLFLRSVAPTTNEDTPHGRIADSLIVQPTDHRMPGTQPGSAQRTRVNPWFQGLVLLWLVALLLQAARLVLAHRHLRGIVARSVPWPGGEMSVLAARVGLKRTPQVRMSDAIDCPQVFGLLSPVVLLPAEAMTALSEEERTMTLCHELMHIRRHDLLFGWVPACAERLFFFHPLARLGAREYVAARESACDAAAVRALGVEADDYGRMLVRLGIGHARPALSVGGSPISTSSLKRRLEMLETRRLSTLSRRWRWALATLAAVVVPMQLVARTPEAPQVTPSVTVEGTVTTETPFDGNSLELENAQLLIDAGGDVIQVVADKLKVEKLKAKMERELGKEIVLLVDTRESLLGTAEQARGVQEKAERARIEETMALIAKVQEENARADKQRVIEDLAKELEQRQARERDVTRAQEAARRVDRQAREVTRAPQVTQQQRLERLLEQLERLSAEQQRLLEEIRRLQQQPRE
jgi:beta-lactamase regulating signal transducer with metallopeptidase domain